MDLTRFKIRFAIGFLILSFLFTGCKMVSVKYSFSGANTDKLLTASVLYFQNRAALVQPTLSQDITDALIDKIKAQTKLKMVSSGGDASFEGYITDYKSQPFTATSVDQNATNRFTISVRVKYVNNANPDNNFEQVFTRYEDYSSGLDFSSVESELSEKIIDLLVEDIFNKAFVNW